MCKICTCKTQDIAETLEEIKRNKEIYCVHGSEGSVWLRCQFFPDWPINSMQWFFCRTWQVDSKNLYGNTKALEHILRKQ